MADIETLVDALHQQAVALSATVVQKDHTSLLPKAKKLARHLNQLVVLDRPLALALLTIYNQKYPGSAQWTIKLGLLTALLAHELKMLETISETLVRAAITMDIAALDVLNARFKAQSISSEMKKRWRTHPTLSAAILKKSGVTDDLWLAHVQQHHERLNGTGFPHRLNQSQLLSTSLLLSLANDALELLMPTTKRHGIDPDRVLTRLYFNKSLYLRAHISALARLFQPVLIGAQVKLRKGKIALILRKPGKDYVWAVQPIKTRAKQNSEEVIKLERPDVERVYPMLNIEAPDLLAIWLEGHKQMSNNQQHEWLAPTPKPSKLKVQLNKLLSDTQPNITRVTQYVVTEPALAQLVMELANRQVSTARPTRDVKHAVMMIGLDRLGPILIRSDLLSELKRRRFPFDYLAYHAIQLFSECVAQLATQSYFMMPEQARTLATFATCGWLLDPMLQQRAGLNTRADATVLSKTTLVETSTLFGLLSESPHHELATHGVNMAEQWQLSLNLVATLEVFAQQKEPEEVNLKSRHPYYLLELASQMHLELMGQKSSHQEKNALMTRLDISAEQYQSASDAVLACELAYTPLPQY